MKKLFTILFALIFFQNNQINAKQINASDISYQCTEVKNVYKVTVKVYRDCTGENLCSGCSNAIPNGNTNGCTLLNAGFTTAIAGTENEFKGVVYGSFNLTAVTTVPNGYEIVQPQKCIKISSICTNCNTRSAGTFSPGIEVYTFEGLVDLNIVPVACCNIALSISINGRNTSLTNMVAENYYNECIVNRCITSCNSSPTFTNDAYALVCAGVDYVYQIAAIDPDGDSLSYKLVSCLKDRGVPVTYVAPFNANSPFSFFGFPNVNAAYPAGLHINPNDGDITFRPTNNTNANFVVEVTQWNLNNGVITKMGVMNREIQIQTANCLGNRIPMILAYKDGVKQPNLNFYAQRGKQFCIDIVASDQVDQTSNPPVLADTTVIKWNNPGMYNPVLATSTFTRKYILSNRGIDGPKADSFKFCWTPPFSAIRKQPHSFTVTGTDRFCPIRAYATRGVNITVGEYALANSNIQNESFSIYPNPAKNSLFINLKNRFNTHSTISIIDILGKEIYQFTPTNAEMEIDISKLLNGVYFVKLSDEKGLFTQKFIKE
ncbi:MAG: T9SS type A sorting domain-containing protein [Bacteroidia bacterium]